MTALPTIQLLTKEQQIRAHLLQEMLDHTNDLRLALDVAQDAERWLLGTVEKTAELVLPILVREQVSTVLSELALEDRLRKAGAEFLKDGSMAKNPQRMGPLTFEARLYGLGRVLDIQARINSAAVELGRPTIDILNAEEEARIRELIAAGTWPQGWDGEEPTADTPMASVFSDGTVQELLL